MAGQRNAVARRLEAFEQRVLRGEAFDRYRIAAELGMARREIENLSEPATTGQGSNGASDDRGAGGA
ncbi:MAG: hypothetical protein MI785_03510 [Kiloniellales bacterium]|nr:hypothetical protein [Kiloniellales bacterium]